MDKQQQLLQLSAKLFRFLENVPKGEDRDVFLTEVSRLLDERGQVLKSIHDEDIKMDSENEIHGMLIELDKGIQVRLNAVMEVVKRDMKNLQTAKKKEKQYNNPYSSVGVMDGRYYDKKK